MSLRTRKSFQFFYPFFILALLLLVSVLGSGCSGLKARTDVEPLVAPKTPVLVSGNELTVLGVRLKNTEFDFPVVINSQVEFWVEYFVGRGREHFQKYLDRSHLFIPFIRPVLRENQMPEDLVYLAMIESGFNNHARSHAKAVGPWQFISATGKRYGLMVNWWVDERRDTHKSTLAAVRYLRDLYEMFQSWELASAAYNAGESKVARAIRRYGTKDFWQISKYRFLRPETRNYVPKIIAAAIVAKNAEQFGFSINLPTESHEGETVSGTGEWVKVVKEENTNPPPEEVPINPSLASETESPLADPTSEPLTPFATELRARTIATPHVNKKGELGGESLVEIELHSPADILMIARASGLSYQTVKGLNPELLRWCTPPMVRSYVVRLPASVKDRFLTAYNDSEFERKIDFRRHKVRPGETLKKIASRFGIRPEPLVDLNRVRADVRLRVGDKVLLPIPDDQTRSMASLELRDAPLRRRSSSNKNKKSKTR